MSNDDEKKMNKPGEKETAGRRQAGAPKSQNAAKAAARKKATAGANSGDAARQATKPKQGGKKAVAKTHEKTSSGSSTATEAMAAQPPASPIQENCKIEEVVKFTLDRQLYGLPTRQIVEVLRMVAFSKLPKQPKGMLGVINFRGEVIPLLDLRQVIDLSPRHLTLNTPILVARVDERLLGLVVDEVLEVEAVPLDTQTQVDELSAAVSYVAAVARVEEGLLLITDLEEIQQALPNVALKITLAS